MPATIVVGGQYGSEGKGQGSRPLGDTSQPLHGSSAVADRILAIQLLSMAKMSFSVRFPVALEPQNATFCLAAGCAIDEAVLLRRDQDLNIDRSRVIVDPARCQIVTGPGSRSGTSRIERTSPVRILVPEPALVRRMSRRLEVPLAKDSSTRWGALSNLETVAPVLSPTLARWG